MTSLRNRLGLAARNLLEIAFGREGRRYSSGLAGGGIWQVSDTYESDPAASRQLLSRVFSPERFERYAHIEVPRVAGRIATFAAVDPDFAVALYGEIFSRTISSQKSTPMGSGSIISMHSTEAQDYQMARFHLSQFFPVFLEDDFERAVVAAIRAVEGYAALQNASSQEDPGEDFGSLFEESVEAILAEDAIPMEDEMGIDEPEFGELPRESVNERATDWTCSVGERTIHFSEDRSWGWAWDPAFIHPDDALSILQTLVDWLRSCLAEKARAAVRVIFAENRLALIWTRLFMVAAERPEVFEDLLWPLVTNEQVLQSMDMGKDAIDAIAAFYPSRTEEVRQTFEWRVFEFDFSHFFDPAEMRAARLAKIFEAIGKDRLATEEARSFLSRERDAELALNNRPITITSSHGLPPDNWWLSRQGIDVESPEVKAILSLSKKVQAALGWEGVQPPRQVDDIDGALTTLIDLESAMEAGKAAGVPDEVLRVPADALARGCSAVLHTSGIDSVGHQGHLRAIQQMTLRLCSSLYPLGGAETEMPFEESPMLSLPAARAAAADNIVRICELRTVREEELVDALQILRTDSHPAIRTIVAKGIRSTSGWGLDVMWSLAEEIVASETNSTVLRGLVNASLSRTQRWDAARTESLLLRLQELLDTSLTRRKSQEGLRGDVAALLAGLYVWDSREDAGSVVRAWCADPKGREIELHSALFATRNALIYGYEQPSPKTRSVRKRSQELIGMVVDSTARGLSIFLALGSVEQGKREAEGRSLAKSLNQASSQLYFVSGAFKEMGVHEKRGLKSTAEKAIFLSELGTVLRRLGDIGTPAVIYQLLQMLEFLFPADPEICFDLVSHALLDGGKRNGYEFESMNADIFVKFVGMCLADYRYAFRDAKRRENLIDSLDAFIEAGWSSARRLIFELPRLIQ
jgi:hypothetical protein